MIIIWNLFKLRAPAAKVIPHPGAQGLLVFQYGGCKREDPGTQQKSRDRFVHGEWKFIQNGGQTRVRESGYENLRLVKKNENGGKGELDVLIKRRYK